MPTYDYECDACQHTFEEFQSINADPLKKCPKCKKNKLRRLFGAGAAVMFKGSGFYTTDYRSDSYKKAASADKSPGDGGGKSESKAESKSESKAESKSESTTSKDSGSKKSGDSKK